MYVLPESMVSVIKPFTVAYVLCCLHHYPFHLMPVFIYIQVFPLFFLYLVSNHAFIFLTSLFLLQFPYTYSWLELLMLPFCCIKPHVHTLVRTLTLG